MENLLPTITIVLAEISVVLLALLGLLLYRYARRKRIHQAEVETLMELASGHRIALPPASPQRSPAAAAARHKAPEAPPPPPPEKSGAEPAAVADALARSLAQIHQAIETVDLKISQLRHDHHKLAANLQHLIEKAGKDVTSGRRELEKLGQIMNRIREGMDSVAGQVASQPPGPASPNPVSLRPEPSTPARRTPPAEDPDFILDAHTLDRLMGTAEYGVPAGGGIDVREISLSDLNLDDPHGVEQPAANPFGKDPIFFQSSSTEEMERGWYFSVSGAQPQGPFADKQTALRALGEIEGKRGGVAAQGG